MVVGAIDVLLLAGLLLTTWRLVPPAWLSDGDAARFPERVRIGSVLAMPGARWHTAERNVLLVISTGCSACGKQADFFARLSDDISRMPGVSLTVASPDSEVVLASWLAQHGVRAPSVLSNVSLADLGIAVVPTIVVVDSSGIVSDVITGGVSPRVAEHLRGRLAGTRSEPINTAKVGEFVRAADLDELRRNSGAVLLDVRAREDFKRASVEGAVNIPHDEVEVRAPVELASAKAVIVDCTATPLSRCDAATEVLMAVGIERVYLLVSR